MTPLMCQDRVKVKGTPDLPPDMHRCCDGVKAPGIKDDGAVPRTPSRADLLLANAALIALGVVLFRFPVVTAVGVAVAWDLTLVLSRRAPSLLPGPRPGAPWTDQDRLREGDFLSLLASNGIFAWAVLFLALSGMAAESQEAPIEFAALLALGHFFVGFGLLMLGITYAALKAQALRSGPGPGIVDAVLDQASALALVMFFAYGLQLLPAIVPVAAPLGALGFAIFIGCQVAIRRRGRHLGRRAQAIALARSLLTAPFVAMVLMFFAASPVRTHFLMDIGYEMHFMFAAFVLVPVLATPALAGLAGGWRHALGSGARTVAALVLAFLTFLAAWFLSQAGVDVMPAYELVLPPALR